MTEPSARPSTALRRRLARLAPWSAGFHAFVDWFIPPSVLANQRAAQPVRMFLISHFFGPFLGHPITIFLLLIDNTGVSHVAVLGASISAFWLFPFAVKLGVRYQVLALVSVQNLIFAILWGSYHYGGASSPFLMWLLVVPLLAFFYLSDRFTLRIRIALFAMIALNLAAFYLSSLLGHGFPEHIPLTNMTLVGVISTFCASAYVFMMAVYYARVVDSQSELLKEIDRHYETMNQLLRSKEEAERANSAKSEFLARMSHELRTPLNAVIGYAEILLEQAEMDGRGEDIADLDRIGAAGRHLLEMVNDVLDISKIEAGKMEVRLEDVDLAAFAEQVEATSRSLLARNANAFVVEREPDLGVVRTDPTKLRQAVLNLLSNAGKFTQNGRVTLSIRRETTKGVPWIAIAVRDTGIGISPEQRQRLFQNFSQADASIASKYGGTGLGLSLSQRLCRLMGGSIEVESELGRGSCFTIRIPAVAGAAAAAAPAAQRAPKVAPTQPSWRAAPAPAKPVTPAAFAATVPAAPRPVGGPAAGRVLVIDGDRELLADAEEALGERGYDVVLADDVQTGLQMARTAAPAVIVVGTGRAGGTWAPLQALSGMCKTVPMIALLGAGDAPETAAAFGAVDSVSKSSGTGLVEAVGRALRPGTTAAADRELERMAR